ncbi:MAG TPA: ModD protein, partial [Rhodospirillaceae bacterium]|nr:ModD protein [Rhodospirillaceae bacterium]
TFHARTALVSCGTEEASRLLTRLDCAPTLGLASGQNAAAGSLLLSATGPAQAILAGWKVAQSLLEHAAAIASCAAEIVAQARQVKPSVVVACTRKNFPGTRAMAIKAIIAGGAVPHRLGLSDSLLLFPEHRQLLAGMTLAGAVQRLKESCPEKKVVVEVTSLLDAEKALKAGADVIQLEKFSPEQVGEVVARAAESRSLIAAAGGINSGNAAAYAQAGAHILVTSAPYGAAPMEVAVRISPGLPALGRSKEML